MMRGMEEGFRRSSMALQDKILEESCTELTEQIRDNLSRNGTDISCNLQDPYGDGGQSKVTAGQAQLYRDLVATGADINHIAESGCRQLSEFSRNCILGNVSDVQKKLDEAMSSTEEEGPPPLELIHLLEKREWPCDCRLLCFS